MLDRFRYLPDRIRRGWRYRYTKSNLDGSHPAIVSIYVATGTHIEVIKREPGSQTLAYVTADPDWTLFSAAYMTSWHIHPDGSMTPQAFSDINTAARTYNVYLGQATFPAIVPTFPVHNYNFDFISLNFTFPHLIDPEAPFQVGVVEPDWQVINAPGFAPTGVTRDVLVYRGQADIVYGGREAYQGTPCRKYRISGPGMGNEVGFIWADETLGHWVNFEHPHPDNPAWSSFKFELLSLDQITLGQWRRYINEELEAAQTYEG